MFDFTNYEKLKTAGDFDVIFRCPEYSYLLLKEKNLTNKTREEAFATVLRSSRFSLMLLKDENYFPVERKKLIEAVAREAKIIYECLLNVELIPLERKFLIEKVIKEDTYSCVFILRDCQLSNYERQILIDAIKGYAMDAFCTIRLVNLSNEEYVELFRVIINDVNALVSFVYDLNSGKKNQLTSELISEMIDKIIEYDKYTLAKYLLQARNVSLSNKDVDKINALLIMHKLSTNE